MISDVNIPMKIQIIAVVIRLLHKKFKYETVNVAWVKRSK